MRLLTAVYKQLLFLIKKLEKLRRKQDIEKYKKTSLVV